MDLYNGKVRLKGDVRNEVAKKNLTVPEILILRRMHGNDAVLNLELVEKKKMKAATERKRLQSVYGRGLKAMTPPLSIERLFGTYGPLPEKLSDVEADDEIEDEIEEDDDELEESSEAEEENDDEQEEKTPAKAKTPAKKKAKPAKAKKSAAALPKLPKGTGGKFEKGNKAAAGRRAQGAPKRKETTEDVVNRVAGKGKPGSVEELM
jgi:hypothetical protein